MNNSERTPDLQNDSYLDSPQRLTADRYDPSAPAESLRQASPPTDSFAQPPALGKAGERISKIQRKPLRQRTTSAGSAQGYDPSQVIVVGMDSTAQRGPGSPPAQQIVGASPPPQHTLGASSPSQQMLGISPSPQLGIASTSSTSLGSGSHLGDSETGGMDRLSVVEESSERLSIEQPPVVPPPTEQMLREQQLAQQQRATSPPVERQLIEHPPQIEMAPVVAPSPPQIAAGWQYVEHPPVVQPYPGPLASADNATGQSPTNQAPSEHMNALTQEVEDSIKDLDVNPSQNPQQVEEDDRYPPANPADRHPPFPLQQSDRFLPPVQHIIRTDSDYTTPNEPAGHRIGTPELQKLNTAQPIGNNVGMPTETSNVQYSAAGENPWNESSQTQALAQPPQAGPPQAGPPQTESPQYGRYQAGPPEAGPRTITEEHQEKITETPSQTAAPYYDDGPEVLEGARFISSAPHRRPRRDSGDSEEFFPISALPLPPDSIFGFDEQISGSLFRPRDMGSDGLRPVSSTQGSNPKAETDTLRQNSSIVAGDRGTSTSDTRQPTATGSNLDIRPVAMSGLPAYRKPRTEEPPSVKSMPSYMKNSSTRPKPERLPPGWEWYHNVLGEPFFVNRMEGKATRINPTNIPKPSDLGALPEGWVASETDEGRKFFIDHKHNDRSTWKDPRFNHLFEAYPLPLDWDWDVTQGGQLFFINHRAQENTLEDPRSFLIQPTPLDMPLGWGMSETPDGEISFFDTVAQEYSKVPPLAADPRPDQRAQEMTPVSSSISTPPPRERSIGGSTPNPDHQQTYQAPQQQAPTSSVVTQQPSAQPQYLQQSQHQHQSPQPHQPPSQPIQQPQPQYQQQPPPQAYEQQPPQRFPEPQYGQPIYQQPQPQPQQQQQYQQSQPPVQPQPQPQMPVATAVQATPNQSYAPSLSYAPSIAASHVTSPPNGGQHLLGPSAATNTSGSASHRQSVSSHGNAQSISGVSSVTHTADGGQRQTPTSPAAASNYSGPGQHHSLCCHCEQGIAYGWYYERCSFCDLDICFGCARANRHPEGHQSARTVMEVRNTDPFLYPNRVCALCRTPGQQYLDCKTCPFSVCANCHAMRRGTVNHSHQNSCLSRFSDPADPRHGIDVARIGRDGTPHGQCCTDRIIGHCPRCLKAERDEINICLDCPPALSGHCDECTTWLQRWPGHQNLGQHRNITLSYYKITGKEFTNRKAEGSIVVCVTCEQPIRASDFPSEKTFGSIKEHTVQNPLHHRFICLVDMNALRKVASVAYVNCARKPIRQDPVPSQNKTTMYECGRCRKGTKLKNLFSCVPCVTDPAGIRVCRHCFPYIAGTHEKESGHKPEDFICEADPVVQDNMLKIAWQAKQNHVGRVWYQCILDQTTGRMSRPTFERERGLRGPDDPVPPQTFGGQGGFKTTSAPSGTGFRQSLSLKAPQPGPMSLNQGRMAPPNNVLPPSANYRASVGQGQMPPPQQPQQPPQQPQQPQQPPVPVPPAFQHTGFPPAGSPAQGRRESGQSPSAYGSNQQQSPQQQPQQWSPNQVASPSQGPPGGQFAQPRMPQPQQSPVGMVNQPVMGMRAPTSWMDPRASTSSTPAPGMPPAQYR